VRNLLGGDEAGVVDFGRVVGMSGGKVHAEVEK